MRKYEDLFEQAVTFIVEANQDLVDAVEAEQYEQAAFVQTAINLFLTNHSQLLSEINPVLTASQIFDSLKEQSDFVFQIIKNNQDED